MKVREAAIDFSRARANLLPFLGSRVRSLGSAPPVEASTASFQNPRLASLAIEERDLVQQLSLARLLEDTLAKLVWTRHMELTLRVPCLLEAHRVSVAQEVKQHTRADCLEDEVQMAQSEINRLSEELVNLKLALDSAEAAQRATEQSTVEEQAHCSAEVARHQIELTTYKMGRMINGRPGSRCLWLPRNSTTYLGPGLTSSSSKASWMWWNSFGPKIILPLVPQRPPLIPTRCWIPFVHSLRIIWFLTISPTKLGSYLVTGGCEMKRAAPWEKSLEISSDDSSGSESEDGAPRKKAPTKDGGPQSKDYMSKGSSSRGELDSKKKKPGGLNFEALSKHGYRGGPSILKVPPPRINDKEQDWSWSTGRGSDASKSITEESFEEREHTRAIVAQGEKLLNVTTSQQSDKKDKNLSFSQKEKRKRDLGQASRGKSYVEEEKRLLRESGIYSGFDS
ncbi:hypothetical protein ZIOFF_002762 [Zingiber officinale]|uniref:Uncharacterized protein n=1 Tax=Zingiber officinale TaxID=94328 RepID=A0A8J5HXD7_ZINOF|nr:hypothetical protein ZIOFF_002762 [Zingiber officinale]